MISKVRVRIESSIENLDSCGLAEGDAEKSVSEVNGVYRFSDGNGSVSFTESTEGGECKTQVLCIGGGVTVRRSGAIESEMYFAEGESHSSVYAIPPYRFDVRVNALRVRVELNEAGGMINLIYNMKIGGADKSARMKIWILQPSNQS